MSFAIVALSRAARLRDAGINWLGNFWQKNLRWIVPLLVLLISAGLGLLAPRGDTRAVFFVVIGAIAVAPLAYVGLRLVVQRRELAPVLILIACAFIPVSVPVRGSSYVLSLVLTIVFVVLWVLRMITVERRLSLLPTPYNVPLLGFMAAALISLFWSNAFRDSVVVSWPSFPFVQVSAALVMIMLPALFLLVVNYVHHVRWLRVIVVIMLIAGVLGVIQQLVFPIIPVQIRGTFTMWVAALSMALVLFHRGLSIWVRTCLVGLVAAWLYWALGLTFAWLVSWLPTVIALAAVFFLRSRRLFLCVLCMAAIGVAMNAATITADIDRENQESGETRLAAWTQNWIITREHLIFGTGPAGYAVYYMTYFPRNAMATHNNYIDILSQVGIVGFLFYASFFVTIALSGYRLCQRLRGRGDFIEALANAAFAGSLGCLAVNAFGDWLIPFAYTQGIRGYDYAAYNWLFLAVIPVLERLTRPAALTPTVHA